MGIPELIVVLAISSLIVGVLFGVRAAARFFAGQRLALHNLEPSVSPPIAAAADSETRAVAIGPVGDLEPGLQFASRYTIKRLLGRGGMGVVYEAWDNELDSPVAVKLILPGTAADAARSGALTQRLKQELQLARRVTHRNVLRIHDIGEAAGAKYITMPMVAGTDLGEVLRAAPLPVDRALAIWRQVVEGLEAAHEAQVIHRDLKPQNILIDTDDRVYVSDFGLAKSLEPGGAALTQTGELHCTPRYVAPEQLSGKPADAVSDLYALGLILHEMLTGDIPFKGNSPMEIMFARLGPMPADPCLDNPRIPAGVGRLILRCLEQDPKRRYQNAREVLADLDAAGRPVSAR